jgi:hypothetical protein
VAFFLHHPDVFEATTYEIQSSVPLDIIELFARSLETGAEIPLTQANAPFLSLLAKEFWIDELFSECSIYLASCSAQLVTQLSELISQLESQLNSRSWEITQLKRSMIFHQTQLDNLNCRVSALETNVARMESDLMELTSAPQVPRPRKLKKIEVRGGSIGIIGHLTRKHSGNLQEQGILTITSKSVHDDDPSHSVQTLADFPTTFVFPMTRFDVPANPTCFCSQDEPGQWICWDFHARLVRQTHYTISRRGQKFIAPSTIVV